MPESIFETMDPEKIARSGMWLGTSACAVKGCKWQCRTNDFNLHQARDSAGHSWDQQLRRQICNVHTGMIKNSISIII